MSNIYYVTYSIPVSLPDEEHQRIERELDALLGRKYETIEGREGVSISAWDRTYRTPDSPDEAMRKFTAISNDLRVLLLPRNESQEWVCNPSYIWQPLSVNIFRTNPTETDRRVSDLFAGMDS